MPNDILGYCGVRLQSANGLVEAAASRIEGRWNTGAALYDMGGGTRYLVWGDTDGNLNVFDMEVSEVANSVHKVINNYESALTIQILTDEIGEDPVEVIQFDACCYQTGAITKALKPLASRLVLEGSTDFKIFCPND